jgi:lysophospholipase L1-like esterase
MKEPYLLAASLLTGLAIPTSTLPQLSSIPNLNTGFLWDLPQRSGFLGDKKIPTGREPFFPVLSSQILTALKSSQPLTGEEVNDYVHISLAKIRTSTKSSFNPSSPPTNQTIVSGDQLYRQRLSALKIGQIYTRAEDEHRPLEGESNNRHQLTYQDWKSLLAMEAKAVSQGQGKNRLSILLGDSLSMWFPREKLPSGKLWLNQGISGDTADGVLKRLTAFSETKAEVIYLMVGINDLRRGTNDMSILHNYRRILHRLHQSHPHTQIIVQSILPTRLTTISSSHIRRLNGQIAWIAKQEGANYLNIYNWFTDTEDKLRSDLTTDGIHLSAEGYDVWRSSIQQIEFKLSRL